MRFRSWLRPSVSAQRASALETGMGDSEGCKSERTELRFRNVDSALISGADKTTKSHCACSVAHHTAGRLICCSAYKISHGYFVRVPARAWYTWRGELLE